MYPTESVNLTPMSVSTEMPIGGDGFSLAYLIPGYGQYKSQQSANQANKELAQYEWQKNIEMWNMQNAYNTPANQMARYREAGLNPNLIYGQGTPGNATHAPVYSKPRMEAPRVPDISELASAVVPMLSAFTDMRVKSAQADNIKANTAATLLDTKYQDWSFDDRLNELGGRAIQAIYGGRRAEREFESYNRMLPTLESTQRSVAARTASEARSARIEAMMNELGVSKSDNLIERLGSLLMRWLFPKVHF